MASHLAKCSMMGICLVLLVSFEGLASDDPPRNSESEFQTHGELLHWHPHLHMLVTFGAFAPEGEFLEVLGRCRSRRVIGPQLRTRSGPEPLQFQGSPDRDR